MDLDLPSELTCLQAEALAVGAEWAQRRAFPDDSWVTGYDRQFALELGRQGWIGMTWPTEVGGYGRSALERFIVFEALISTGAPIASMWIADRQIGPVLLEFGTEAQRERFLPGILAGSSMWCIGLSEPDAGSDLASLRTTAVRDGDEWVISGRKVWTSGALDADWCYVVARTDPDAPQHKGLSEFVVDMGSPGISVSPITDMTGDRHFSEVTFDAVRVAADDLIGEPNGSFAQVMRQLEHERGGVDRLVSNLRLYRDVVGSGLVDRSNPMLRDDLAKIECRYRIGRLMVLREALGQAPKGFSAATKTFCTELEQRVAVFCAKATGTSSLLWGAEYGLSGRVARNVCYAPAYTIQGGTTQVLRNIVAERLLGLPR